MTGLPVTADDVGPRARARAQLIDRLRPFCEDSAAMWLAGFLDDSSAWPEGAELNDVFTVEENGPMRPMSEITFWDVDHERAPSRLAEFLHTGLAYSNVLAADRVEAAVQLGKDLVAFFGPSATWRISEEEWQTNKNGGKSKVCSSITDDTFSAMMIGRSDHDVLILIAADED
jgi:hypothetical protein